MLLKKTKTQQQEKANPPIAKVRVGLITASIWERSTENGAFYSVSFERRYRDGEGNWKSSHSYDTQDLLSLAKAADLALVSDVEVKKRFELAKISMHRVADVGFDLSSKLGELLVEQNDLADLGTIKTAVLPYSRPTLHCEPRSTTATCGFCFTNGT